VLIEHATQVDNLKPMTPACREAYRYWGPLPSQSTSLWAYIAFQFLLVLVPLPKVVALSRDMADENDETLEESYPFATLRNCPICPKEYFLLSVISAIHMQKVTRYSALLADLGLMGQLLAVMHWRRDRRESPVAFLQAGTHLIPVADVPGMVNGGVRCQMWCGPGNPGL
jgi:hypothetical protein